MDWYLSVSIPASPATFLGAIELALVWVPTIGFATPTVGLFAMLIVPVATTIMILLVRATSIIIVVPLPVTTFVLTLAPEVGVLIISTDLINQAVVTVAIILMGGWISGSEQLDQITSEGGDINLGTAAAYCGYHFLASYYFVYGASVFSSSSLGQFTVAINPPHFTATLCGTYRVDVNATSPDAGSACSSSLYTHPCREGWGTINDPGYLTSWETLGTFSIHDSNLLQSNPPQS